MRRLFPVLLVALAAVLPVAAGSSRALAASSPTPADPSPSATPPEVLRQGAPPTPAVDIVEVSGVIDRAVDGFLTSTLDDAETAGDTVVIQLNTPGTLDVSAAVLAERVFESRVPVIVWVGPSGSHAKGAGLLFLYAASVSAVSPGSGVGPLEPLDLAHKPGQENPSVRSRALRMVDRWGTARGRGVSFASEGVEVAAQPALDARVADLAASSVADLLQKVNGRRVPTAAGPVTLRTNPHMAVLRFHELGPGRRILHAVTQPVAIYILLILAMAGIAFELTQSGIGVAGIAGLAALGLAVYGLTAVPFSPLGLGLLLGGLAMLTLDVQLHRLGPISVLGMGAFVAGSILVFGRVAPAIDLGPWLIGFSTAAVFLYYGFALTVAQRSRERIVSTRRGLVGLVGETRGELSPDGPVFVKGTLWRGRAMDGPIPPGTRVRVRRVEGLILRVEAEEEPPSPNGD